MADSVTTAPASLPSAAPTTSFWQSEPSELLLGHNTTKRLPEEADIVIIGSGITGSFIARFLQQLPHNENILIVMLEAREVCSGATGRNGGHCQPLLYLKPPKLAAWESKNYEFIRSLVELNQIACEWRSLAACHAFRTEFELSEAIEGLHRLQRANPTLARQCKLITPESKSPSLEDLRVPTALGAMTIERAASLWPYKLIAWVLEQILTANSTSTPEPRATFNLQTNTPATRLENLGDSTWAVHTSRGIIKSKKVLLASNGYTSHLLPDFAELIVPVRGEIAALPAPTEMVSPLPTSYGFVGHDGDMDDSEYLIQRPDNGQLMFGGALHLAPNAGVGLSDDSINHNPTSEYLKRNLPVFMTLQDSPPGPLRATHVWTGIMGYSRDSHPWVGPVPGKSGLWICAGFTGHGMPNAVLSAKALAEMVLASGTADAWSLVEKRLVDEGNLPKEFVITRDRMQLAMKLPEVRSQRSQIKK